MLICYSTKKNSNKKISVCQKYIISQKIHFLIKNILIRNYWHLEKIYFASHLVCECWVSGRYSNHRDVIKPTSVRNRSRGKVTCQGVGNYHRINLKHNKNKSNLDFCLCLDVTYPSGDQVFANVQSCSYGIRIHQHCFCIIGDAFSYIRLLKV